MIVSAMLEDVLRFVVALKHPASASDRQTYFLGSPSNGGLFGHAVQIARLTLGLGGGWAPEAGVIDRMGRALGWAWVAAFVAFFMLQRPLG